MYDHNKIYFVIDIISNNTLSQYSLLTLLYGLDMTIDTVTKQF